MRINLALLNILHSPRKTALSVAGIGIAILLIFMQLGFRGAVENTATNIYGKLDFDVLLRSADYLHFVDSGKFERQFLEYASGLESVESTNQLDVSIANWRNPVKETSRGMMVLGLRPTHSPFKDREVDQHFELLKTDSTVLVDRQSHFEFGPLNGKKFTSQDIGCETELSGKKVKIAETFSMGAGLAANGACIVSQNAFQRIFPHSNPQKISFGLVKLRPGQSATDVVARLNQHFKVGDGEASVQVLTRDEVISLELDRWLNETPIGFIFTLGVLIALIVGAAIVYMVLGNDVSNRLHEYATMRAMGYSNQYLGLTVLRQAGYLALFSFTPALLIAVFLYWITGMLASITMEMNLQRILFVLGMTIIMCAFSGVLAMKKLWKAEPAELF